MSETKPTDPAEAMWRVIAEAQREWNMQAAHGRRPPEGMSEIAAGAYFDQRLIGKLHNILIFAGKVPGREWEMHCE